MNISTLTPSELGDQLKETGIFLQTGTFTIHLKTSIPSITEGIGMLYADYPLIEKVI